MMQTACKDDVTAKWNAIRSAYKDALPVIMKNEEKGRGVDPYFLDWFSSMTPIEQIVWNDIRCNGGRFYPQFPVLNYFIDFANPYKKIGIEADGIQWHDINKDRDRDNKLIHHGWRIFRIKGSEAWKSIDPPHFTGEESKNYQYKKMSEWFMTTSEGVIAAIQEFYFDHSFYTKYHGLCHCTLEAHRIVDFQIS